MSLDLSHPDIEFAVESVRLAARLAEEIRSEISSATTAAPPSAITKNDKSPVTVADFSSQAIVARRLAEKFPNDILVAEEDSSFLQSPGGKKSLDLVCEYLNRYVPGVTLQKAIDWVDRGKGEPSNRRFWTMDPIDGTKGFLRGEQYAVALALVVNGRVTLGVLGCPNLKRISPGEPEGLGTLAVAARGQGAWKTSIYGKDEWAPLTVSKCTEPAQAVLLRSLESAHTDISQTQELIKELGIVKPALLMDSLAKYAVLAGGGADLLFRFPSPDQPDRHEWIWDQAPGAIIVEEAGGTVTDLRGNPLEFWRGRQLSANFGVLLSNGNLHPAAISALTKLHRQSSGTVVT